MTLPLRALTFVVLLGCSASAQAQRSGISRAPMSYASKVGVVGPVANGGICLSIGNPSLAVGATISLVDVPIPGEYHSADVLTAQIVPKKPSSCDTDSLHYFQRDRDSLYLIRSARTGACSEFCFGVVAEVDQLHVRGQAVAADLDGDGVLETFRACTTREGVHLTVWSGEPLKGKRVWPLRTRRLRDRADLCRARLQGLAIGSGLTCA